MKLRGFSFFGGSKVQRFKGSKVFTGLLSKRFAEFFTKLHKVYRKEPSAWPVLLGWILIRSEIKQIILPEIAFSV